MAKFEINCVHLCITTIEIQYCSSLGAGLVIFIGAILLVSALLIQPMPIIFGADYIKTAGTKNSDIWCRLG
jgi:hypothetical protein